jgi:hypothetical protein
MSTNYEITPFRASFDSDCLSMLSPECAGRIYEGDNVAYVDGEVACEDCVSWARDQSEDTRLSWAERMAEKARKNT